MLKHSPTLLSVGLAVQALDLAIPAMVGFLNALISASVELVPLITKYTDAYARQSENT